MKRYIRASVKPGYEKVDEVLNLLFGIPYSMYKNKSEYTDTDYGTLRYDIYTKMNNSKSFILKVLFDPETFSPDNFTRLIRDCEANGINVTSTYMSGNKGYARNEPQINIEIPKVIPYTIEDLLQVIAIIKEVGHEVMPDLYLETISVLDPFDSGKTKGPTTDLRYAEEALHYHLRN